MTLTPRTQARPFFLEKWYIDTLLPDGGVMIAYLARVRMLGISLARVTVDFFSAEGAQISGSAVARGVQGGDNWLAFGPARIDGDRLEFETDGLSGSLSFHSRWPAVFLVDPFFRDDSGELHWSVEVPDADVCGELRSPSGLVSIAGRGYRDRVWFDFAPWHFPIKELWWGRAAAGAHAATWVRATTTQGEVRARWEDGKVELDDGQTAELSDRRLLLDERVADLQGLRLGLLRPVLRRLSLDPRETKYAAVAMLGGERGRAIHEVARWRPGR